MTTVAVVGAGLAGLTAGRHLASAGHDVTLLERRPTVGGRVRTTTVDGYTIDRGFQVLFTAYPAVQHELDLDALALRRFTPGATIARPGRRSTLADPRRVPRAAIETLFNTEITLADKLRVLTLHRRLGRRDPATIFPETDQSIRSLLTEYGFSTAFIENVAAPFYGGITLDRSLETAAPVFEYTFSMLAAGAIAVPADGMGAIPRQLATRARDAGAAITTDTTVTAVDPTDDGATVTTETETMSVDAVVVATDPPTAADLTGVDAIPTTGRGCVTQYYTLPAPRAPDTGGRLLLNAADDMPNHVAPLSAVAPEYAPDDRALLAATFLGDPDATDTDLAATTRTTLREWFPERHIDDLEVLHTSHVPFAQFDQPPGCHATLPTPRAPPGQAYLAGDFTRWSSIQGALESGRRAADALTEDLG
ncbi:MAG: NAD(P)/FAD-dependent oxidoreductase [Halobacteriaceae archaeon]